MSEQCNSPGELHFTRRSRRLILPTPGAPPARLCAPLAPLRHQDRPRL